MTYNWKELFKDWDNLTKEKEMCIPKLSPEEMAEEDYQYYSQEIMNEIYKEEVFAQLEKDLQEEESLVVLDPFVRDMCDYYKIPQDNYVMWQHYYDYMKEELNNNMSKVKTKFNEEMKKYIEEKTLEQDMAAIDISNRTHFGGYVDPIWNAIEKHK